MHLLKTFDIIQKLEKSYPQSELQDCMPESPTTTSCTNVDAASTPKNFYARLTQHISQLAENSRRPSEIQRTMKQKLISLANCSMVPVHTNILQHWKYTPVDADILKLIKVALAVPAIQVSVERAFIALSVICTKLRSKLSSSTINNLLITKLNIKEFDNLHINLENLKQ